MSKYVIAVYVDNKPGVLTRVSSMFTRRAFNIDTLTVGEIENPAYSRITISLSGDEYTKNQIVAQLHKLHNVKKVKVLTDESTLKRELMIIKMKNSLSRTSRTTILHDSGKLNGKCALPTRRMLHIFPVQASCALTVLFG